MFNWLKRRRLDWESRGVIEGFTDEDLADRYRGLLSEDFVERRPIVLALESATDGEYLPRLACSQCGKLGLRMTRGDSVHLDCPHCNTRFLPPTDEEVAFGRLIRSLRSIDIPDWLKPAIEAALDEYGAALYESHQEVPSDTA